MSKTKNKEWIKPLMKSLSPVFREVLVMSAFVNILALAVPIFTLQVYDRVIQHAGISTLQGLVIGMTVVFIFEYILRQSRSRIMQTVALRVDVEVGRAVFDKFTSVPLNVLEARSSNDWQSLFRDVDVVRNTLSGAPAILLCDLPFAILFFGLIAVIATPLIWVLGIIIPLFLFVTYRAGSVMGKATNEERNTSQSRDSLIAEMINGRATIKALALEGAMRPVWEERHANNIESSIVRGSNTDKYTNLGQTLTMSTSLFMTTMGATMIINQSMTMGSLIASNMLAGRLLGPLNQLVMHWRTYSGYRLALERLGEVFAIESERMESDVKLSRPEGKIECSNLSFTYAGAAKPVCDNITLSFASKTMHALVGRNGCGKTTLLKMIQGLYRPESGRVVIDGADISQFSRPELARWMGYVPQESTLFAGTVRENITHRFPEATDDQIITASKAAGVHEFIIDLADGYASDIGEAGRRLSGGQRQRIAIARALIGNPSVLLLDEPSSSLDRQAETELRNTLIELSKSHTVIIVTHSPILLAVCENLVALDKGKVALAGPAKEILPQLFGVNKSAASQAKSPSPTQTPPPAPAPNPAPVQQAPVQQAPVQQAPVQQAPAQQAPAQQAPAQHPAPQVPAAATLQQAPAPAPVIAAVAPAIQPVAPSPVPPPLNAAPISAPIPAPIPAPISAPVAQTPAAPAIKSAATPTKSAIRQVGKPKAIKGAGVKLAPQPSQPAPKPQQTAPSPAPAPPKKLVKKPDVITSDPYSDALTSLTQNQKGST